MMGSNVVQAENSVVPDAERQNLVDYEIQESFRVVRVWDDLPGVETRERVERQDGEPFAAM